ncbi:MAG: glycosyltransferase [Solirubrobacteraceae bacterium]|nr:glycosyltransferase [Solirubrobacteraceae bacterium]
MRVLYVAMAHDYGDPARGASFEETNFRSALDGMGHDVTAFDFVAREQAVGRKAMNAELRDLADELAPDVAFFFLFKDEIAPRTIESVRAPTVNWFADDHWRFDDFTRHFAPSFDWSVTTDAESLPKYRALGYDHAILSQWACNRYAYDRVTDELAHEVTFIGQPHGGREKIVASLQEAGFPVECWGYGWPNGRVGHDEMVRIFASSAINLNLSNSSTMPWTLRMRVGAVVRGRRPWSPKRRSQIKGRTFEVPGSGGFLLTEHVPHLEDYFDIDREIATFHSERDLTEKVRYWLEHPDERAAVADAGYRRVRAEHTYDHRFAAIFREMGLT